eukprot:TRINITY_DN4000_c0_g1_i2.p1 TRINITY_DN4000_c0_g1~~TRINITY_DN4000_c0_g1_i2.p1  ORF type:complete len:116 (+),score=28.48 TRINITY_DN4000_c0_g1_i2:54-401(+)
MLRMVERNNRVKRAPEKWHEEKEKFDLVISFDLRVYETIIDDVMQRQREDVGKPVHIINLDTKDTHQEAANAALAALALYERIIGSEDWEDELSEILDEAEQKSGLSILHTVLYY